LYKDISLFQRKRLREVENLSSSLPVDAFNAFGSIYGKLCSADILRKEYLQFCSVYFSFENLIKLPQKLHVNNILHYDTEEEIETAEEDQKTISTYHLCCESFYRT